MRTLCTHICHRLVLSSSPIVPSIVITSSTSLPLYFSSCGDAPSCSLATPIPSPQLIPFPLPYPFLPFPSSPLHPPSLPQLLPFLTPSIPFLTPHSSHSSHSLRLQEIKDLRIKRVTSAAGTGSQEAEALVHLTGAYETQIAALKAETELLQQVRTHSFTRTPHHCYPRITLFRVTSFILPSFFYNLALSHSVIYSIFSYFCIIFYFTYSAAG